ncbi:MAG: ribosome recycling factor [Thiothrix nivea]|nr:MAG: ribosome recycling factor [Thiothrix nivea]
MIDEILQDADSRMHKSIEALKSELTKIRTGRAHASLLDHITVEYYGSEVPLSQVANIAAEDARTLSVTPWEKPMVSVVEKAIMNSDLGLNPLTAGTVIRVPVPPLTEERRRDLVKVVKAEGENTKIAIRNIRRDANSDFKSLEKEKEISEDDERRAQENVQKLTDKFVKEVDVLLEQKEQDLMEI